MGENSFLKIAKTELSLHLHPSRSNVVQVGIQEELNDLLLKYNENFEGVLLAYSDLVIQGNKGSILVSSDPYFRLKMSAKLLLFAPTVGSILDGVVHQTGSNYVHVLVLGMFNAAIRGKHLSDHFYHHQEQWVNPVHYSKEHVDHEIRVGSKIRFTVVGLQVESHENLTIEAAISAPGTGSIDWLNKQKKVGRILDTEEDKELHQTHISKEAETVVVEKGPSETPASKKGKKTKKTELKESGGKTETVRSDDIAIAGLQSPPGRKGARDGGGTPQVASSRQEKANGGGGDKEDDDEIKEPGPLRGISLQDSDRDLKNSSSINENTPATKKRKKRKDEGSNNVQEVEGNLGKTASKGTNARVLQTDGLVGSRKTKKRRKSL